MNKFASHMAFKLVILSHKH